VKETKTYQRSDGIQAGAAAAVAPGFIGSQICLTLSVNRPGFPGELADLDDRLEVTRARFGGVEHGCSIHVPTGGRARLRPTEPESRGD
jgi:hypothetical protein